MAYKEFYIKTNGNYSSKYKWYDSDKEIMKDGSCIGKATTLQDAIDVAKSDCGANKDSKVEMV